jgi:hypothetical protein
VRAELAARAALGAALKPYRKQRNYAQRGHRRVNAVKNGDGSNGRRRIDLTGHVIAWRLREHLHLPCQAIAVLPGIDASTVSHAATLTAALLAGAGIPLPPQARRQTRSRGPPANCSATPPQPGSP